MSTEDIHLVKRKITDGFDVREPPDAELIVAPSADHDIESRELRAAFEGKRWQDVDTEMVARFKDSLPLFTPEGFAYFLPAYLLACLDAPQQVDTALDSVLFSLTPPKPSRGWRREFFESRASLFDAAQACAIEAFLDLQARSEAQDWASAGRTPPPERVGRALSHWRRVVREAPASK